MSSYMKFSDFNNDDQDDMYDRMDPPKLPIREDMSLPRNPPLYSDQYSYRQTSSSPLYLNPYNTKTPSTIRPSFSNHYESQQPMTSTEYYSPYSNRQAISSQYRSPTFLSNNTDNYFHTPPTTSTPQVTELFTMDKPSTSDNNYTTSSQPISCLDVNDHIVTCPLCSNYYKSYSYLYVGIIVILLIIILFLFKSLSEKR